MLVNKCEGTNNILRNFAAEITHLNSNTFCKTVLYFIHVLSSCTRSVWDFKKVNHFSICNILSFLYSKPFNIHVFFHSVKQRNHSI